MSLTPDIEVAYSLASVVIDIDTDTSTVTLTKPGVEIGVPGLSGPKGDPGAPAGGTPVYLLDAGQSMADYEAAHGTTIPDGALIFEKGA